MNLQLVNIQWYLNYAFPLHPLTTHHLTPQPQVVLRQFLRYQPVNLQIMYNNVTPYYLMVDLEFKERSSRAHAQDLVISIRVYSMLRHHNDVLLSVGDKKFEKTNGTHNRYLV